MLISSTLLTWLCPSGQKSQTFEVDARTDVPCVVGSCSRCARTNDCKSEGSTLVEETSAPKATSRLLASCHCACRWPPHGVYLHCCKATLTDLQACIDQGVDVNSTASTRWTALHRAASRGRTEVAVVLMRHGANTNARTALGGETALMLGVSKLPKCLLTCSRPLLRSMLTVNIGVCVRMP